MKSHWLALCLSAAIFACLFSVRIGWIGGFEPPPPVTLPENVRAVPERDAWMKILQNGKKIGYAHTVFSRSDKGYEVEEALRMRLKTMGLTQDLRLRTSARLFSDLSLSSFEFSIVSGPFDFKAEGHMFGKWLHIRTVTGGEVGGMKKRLRKKPYIAAGIMEAVLASGMTEGEKRVFPIFDPATMTRQRVTVKIAGKEKVRVMDDEMDSTKVVMEYKGIEQIAWIGENGEVFRQKGLMGITMEMTTRDDAVSGASLASSDDLTLMVSIPSNVRFEAPERLASAVYRIGGVRDSLLTEADGGRQKLRGDVLSVVKEKPGDAAGTQRDPEKTESLRPFLAPSPFIQSDHENIVQLAESIVSEDDPPLGRVEKIVEWIRENIERRPVLSLPDALSTLENRAGDCNEHAVLTAALARAAGVPARVEAGVVYLRGAFYYHAWNQVYVGRWMTADSLFDQIPADVTHIRLAKGAQEDQVNILGMLGKLEIQVLETTPEGEGSES